MGSLSVWHWLIVLVVVLLVFGTAKLRNLGGDLGGAVKGFRDGMKGEPEIPTLPRNAETHAESTAERTAGSNSGGSAR